MLQHVDLLRLWRVHRKDADQSRSREASNSSTFPSHTISPGYRDRRLLPFLRSSHRSSRCDGCQCSISLLLTERSPERSQLGKLSTPFHRGKTYSAPCRLRPNLSRPDRVSRSALEVQSKAGVHSRSHPLGICSLEKCAPTQQKMLFRAD